MKNRKSNANSEPKTQAAQPRMKTDDAAREEAEESRLTGPVVVGEDGDKDDGLWRNRFS